jgi:hypothetical protein
MLEASIKYYAVGLKIPQSYKEIFNDIYDENDKFKQLLDNYFQITKYETDRVNKDKLVEIYNNVYQTKIDFVKILKDIKRLNLNYEKGKCCDGIRGCITNLRILDDDEREKRNNNVEEKKIEDSDDDEPEPPKQEQKPEIKQEINYESDNEIFDDNSSIIKKCVFGKVNNCVINVQNMSIQQTETKPEVPKRLHTNKRINKKKKEKCVFGLPKQTEEEINEEEQKELDKVCGDVDDDFGLTINWE